MAHTRPSLTQRVATALVGLTLLATLPTVAAAAPGPWRMVTKKNGITVHARDIPGRSLPEFRGTAILKGHLLEIVAILDDTRRHVQWMANCSESKVLAEKDLFVRTLYNRTDAPWPVSDRDVVLLTSVRVNVAKAEVWSDFRSIRSALKRPVSGVVRMPELRGSYHMVAVDKKHTKVVYQVAADPGGLLPTWLARMSTRKLPMNTLTGMQKQLDRMRGRYGAFVKRFDPDQGGSVPDRIRVDKPATPKATPPAP